MRVLQANKFFFPRAGAETAFLQTRELLRERGHEVIDFAMRHPDNLPSPYASFFAPQRAYDRDGGTLGRTRDAMSSVYSVSARRALGRLLDAHRPDVAHLHNVYHQLTLSIVDELAVRRIPIVLTLHDWKIACPAYTLFTQGAPCRRCVSGSFANAVRYRCVKDSAPASFLAAIEAAIAGRRQTYERVQRFAVPSHFGGGIAEIAGVAPHRIEYLPNFLADEELAHDAPAVDHGPHLLYAGRLEPTKGIRPLLAAFKQVRASASLRIAGAGVLEPEVRAAAEQDRRIEYLGWLSREQLYRELDRARAVVLPSLYEDNGPLIILEAQARAKAMIVTSRGGPREFVQHGDSGLVVDPDDLEALAASMERMAVDPDAACGWGRHGQERVRREHTAARHYELLCAVYKRAIEELR